MRRFSSARLGSALGGINLVLFGILRPGDRSTTPWTRSLWPPNHFHAMTRQLDDGVRGLMLDLHYDDDGTPSLCHGDCFWGWRPLVDGLTELRVFLDADPRAVITLLLENYIDLEDIEAAMGASGLLELAFAHPPGTPWPTLGEMIDAGNRVVVLGPGVPRTTPSSSSTTSSQIPSPSPHRQRR